MSEQKPPKILFVDDDQAALTIVRRILEADKFEVETLLSAREALDFLAANHFDAILCDMWMPGMTGKEFYEQIRQRFPQYRNRIIFVTGDIASEATWQFIDQRRLPYLLKPFNIPEMRRQLREMVGERPAQPREEARGGREERRHRRIAIKANVRVREKRWATREPEIAAVVNASKEGVYFITDRKYRVGIEVQVCFPFTGVNDIEQEGCVVRVEEHPDERFGVAIAMGEAGAAARKAFLTAQEERRREQIRPIPAPLVGLSHAEDASSAELAELKRTMALEREESRHLAEQLMDLRETYERVNSQRDRLATDEERLRRELQELVDARAAMTQMVDDLQGQMENLQEQLSETETVRYQATHDALTGLWNRGAILDILTRELSRAQREGMPLGIVLADLDHFKSINDTYGHLAGDAVLREAARRMIASVRDYDAVGRYGGEEFLLVLPGCDLASTVKHADRIRTFLASEQIDAGEAALSVTASMGAASISEATEPEALLRMADEALYRAKRAGRNSVEAALPNGGGNGWAKSAGPSAE